MDVTDSRAELLKKIEAFLAETGMGPTHLGQRAGVGAIVVQRLRDGGDVTTRTADRLNAFINAWPDVPPYSRADSNSRRRSAQPTPQL